MTGKFILHDIGQGIVRHRKRYLLAILIAVISCIAADKEYGYIRSMYGQDFSALEYEIQLFWGRTPYVFDPVTKSTFYVPLAWMMFYLSLAFCIGDYIKKDMRGFGLYMMVKSRSRIIWWISKCVWCFLVNVVYFSCAWLGIVSYEWARYGRLDVKIHKLLFSDAYSSRIADMTMKEILVVSLLLPFLVGVLQSFIQMIVSVVYSGTTGMAVTLIGLVFSSYYGSKWLLHGYGMVCRFFEDITDEILSETFGIWYLGCMILFALIAGYVVVRKKDIYEK